MHRQWLARKYVYAITPKRKELLTEKVLAERLFKSKKSSYYDSIAEAFEVNRLGTARTWNQSHDCKLLQFSDPKDDELRRNVFEVKHKQQNEKTQYCALVNKYDRHGYLSRPRILVITNQKLYLLDRKKMHIKEAIPLRSIKSVVTSNKYDGLFVVQIPIEKKEKVGLQCENSNRKTNHNAAGGPDSGVLSPADRTADQTGQKCRRGQVAHLGIQLVSLWA